MTRIAFEPVVDFSALQTEIPEALECHPRLSWGIHTDLTQMKRLAGSSELGTKCLAQRFNPPERAN